VPSTVVQITSEWPPLLGHSLSAVNIVDSQATNDGAIENSFTGEFRPGYEWARAAEAVGGGAPGPLAVFQGSYI